MKKVQAKTGYKLVGKDGSKVTVKTLTDFKEYVNSKFYTPDTGEEAQVIEEAEFTEVDEEAEAESEAIAETFKALRDKDKALEDMSKEELRAKYEEVLGKKPAGAKGEASLVEDIKAATK